MFFEANTDIVAIELNIYLLIQTLLNLKLGFCYSCHDKKTEFKPLWDIKTAH